jgi:hypothetical protein
MTWTGGRGRQSGESVVGRVQCVVFREKRRRKKKRKKEEGIWLATMWCAVAGAVKAGKAGPARCSDRPYLLHDM